MIRSVIVYIFERNRYFAGFLALSIVLSAAYAFLLHSSALNLSMPKIILGLNAYALSASLAMGILLSLSIVSSAFAILNRTKSNKVGAAAVAIGILPATLCCTTVVPSMLALFGFSASAVISTTGIIQGPFSTYEVEFIAASLLLLVVSIYLNLRSINTTLRCCSVEKTKN
ncbi:MAG: hypothetical protein QXS17_03840 [Candidatus Micrarchaeaceae archaeon]